MKTSNDLGLLLKKLCAELNKSGIPYCVAGGLAVSLWGPPRGTEDIDLIVMIADEERNRLSDLLAARFDLVQSHGEDMTFGPISIWRHVLRFGSSNNLFPVDMIIARDEFLIHALARRIELSYRETTIPVISLEDLVILKLISLRDIDKYDIENLLKSDNPVDWEYLEQEIVKLKLDTIWVRQFKGKKP